MSAADGAACDEVGYSVAISGDTIVVGSSKSDAAASNSGSAYVFTRSGSTWTEKQKITAGDAAMNDRFGIATSLSADGTLVIGASEKNLPNGQGNTAGAAYVFNISNYKVSDFDGDGKTDIGIFRPSDGSWWYSRSGDGEFRVYPFGISTDKPVPGDYTSDGKADPAVFRRSTGEWFFQRSEDNSYYALPFGASTDLPTPGDYDGDGKFDTAVFRPSTGNGFVQRSTAGILITTFGANGDRPIPNSSVP